MVWRLLLLICAITGVAAAQSASGSAKTDAHSRPDVTRSTETQLVDTYYVRAYEHGAYIIEHKGRRLTAKCRNSLAWPNGLGTFGTPVKEHGCVYMHDLLGKTVGEGIMKQWNETLVYSPYAGRNTIQTADYLDISDEEPLVAEAGTRQTRGMSPAPATSIAPRIPSIAKNASESVVSIIMSDNNGKPVGQGSGFFVSKDGLIVTNYHVIAEGSSAVAKLPDGAFYVIDGVLSFDKVRDVAVIKANGKNFQVLALGDSDRVQVGEEVVAIGNPLSLESTVSNGIVSAIRTVEEQGGKFLQVTAPISPGSSGGPLFNMAGEVVGITTMHIRGGENLNFAIPLNDAKHLLASSSTKLSPLPNQPEPQHAQKHDAAGAPSSSTQLSSSPTGRDYFRQLFDAGGFSGNLPAYVCFSDKDGSGSFFTFTAYAYDADYYNAQAKVQVMAPNPVDPSAWTGGKVGEGEFHSEVTPEMMVQFKIMEARQRTMPYVSLLMKSDFETLPAELQKFFRNGGRLLEETIYGKGVKIGSGDWIWNGTSWDRKLPTEHPNGITQVSKTFSISIEPTTMRYAESGTVAITVGSGQTAANSTDHYGPWGGICEKVPNPK
jgi:S1-C subfamily serine protease